MPPVTARCATAEFGILHAKRKKNQEGSVRSRGKASGGTIPTSNRQGSPSCVVLNSLVYEAMAARLWVGGLETGVAERDLEDEVRLETAI